MTVFVAFLLLSPLFLQLMPSTHASILRSTNLRLSDRFSVTDYGAVGDGKKYDTRHIQEAIDACNNAGGGRVIFPASLVFLTGTIFLKSHVILDIEKGAKILAGSNETDYPLESKRWYLILAENATDVGITGGGVIDGNGLKFVQKIDERKNIMVSWNNTGQCLGDECRPRLVGFVDCRNVRIWNVKLTEPAYWCLHLVRCDNTSITDVSIHGDFDTPNNDGIDIEDSNNTFINRCNINTGDDAICPKASTGPVYNLTVTDCWIRTKSSAIKLGSSSWFEFGRMIFDNITISDSHRGLSLQIRDGGNVNDITFSNVKIQTRYYDPSWWGRAEPIYITTCARNPNSKAGSISNLIFTNISAMSENGIFLSGSKDAPLRNLRFFNVNLTYDRWTDFPAGLIDYRPGCRELVNHSSAGVIMEYVSGLEMQNVNMKWSSSGSIGWNSPFYFRPSTVNAISLLDFHSDMYGKKLFV